MSLFKKLFQTIKEESIYVKIKKNNCLKLLEDVGTNDEVITMSVNKIISKYYNNLEEERTINLENEKHEEELLSYYEFLDKYLNATLNNQVQIGITNGLIGKEGSSDYYTLVSYELSNSYKYLTLELKNSDRIYPISFNRIEDIKFLDNGSRLKTWIYMGHTTWRFYLYYDKETFEFT